MKIFFRTTPDSLMKYLICYFSILFLYIGIALLLVIDTSQAYAKKIQATQLRNDTFKRQTTARYLKQTAAQPRGELKNKSTELLEKALNGKVMKQKEDANVTIKTECTECSATLAVDDCEEDSLSSSDCQLNDGTYYDWYCMQFSGGNLEISLTGNFDEYLTIFAPDGTIYDVDSYYSGGETFRLANAPAGQWEIWANSYAVETGTYELCANEFTSPPAPEPPVYSNYMAILVGIDNYSPSYGPGSLPSCVNDATGFREIALLEDPNQRWKPQSVSLYTDQYATKTNIRNAISEVASKAQSGDQFLYVHSSHGGLYQDTDTYLCTYDADYTDSELGQDLGQFDPGVKIVVIIDACHSGGMFKGSIENTFIENVLQAYLKTQRTKPISTGKDLGQNIGFMVASEYDEFSVTENPYSLYIGYLLEACEKTNNADVNRDNYYEYAEIHDYATPLVENVNSNQHPQIYNRDMLKGLIMRNVEENIKNNITPILYLLLDD